MKIVIIIIFILLTFRALSEKGSYDSSREVQRSAEIYYGTPSSDGNGDSSCKGIQGKQG
jgi:hypothetical protein